MSYTKLGLAALTGVAAAYGLNKGGRRADKVVAHWRDRETGDTWVLLPGWYGRDSSEWSYKGTPVFLANANYSPGYEPEVRWHISPNAPIGLSEAQGAIRHFGLVPAAEVEEARDARERDARGQSARGRRASRKHKLMTAELRRKLPALYANENVKDPIVQAKYFTPYGNAYWLITEYDGDDTMFGWAELGAGMGELGYVSLSELDEVVGGSGLLRGIPMVERDLYFDPKPLSEAKRSEQKSRGFAARGRRGRRARERTLEEHIDALQRMFPGTLVRPGVEFDERPIPRIWTSFGEEMKDDVYIADYHRDKYHPKLQQYMDKYDIMPEWYDAGTLFLVPNWLWEKWSSEQWRLRRGRRQ